VIESLTKFLETNNTIIIIQIFRRNRAKVIRQEGNSPDRMIRCPIIVKLKEFSTITDLRGRLGSSHSLKKE